MYFGSQTQQVCVFGPQIFMAVVFKIVLWEKVFEFLWRTPVFIEPFFLDIYLVYFLFIL